MRIIAGHFKGVRLASPRNRGVRPTADRVREALFSTLGQAVEGARTLDLFAGTGALGFEALSRDARCATFVDNDRQAIELLRRNAELLKVTDQVRMLNLNASAALKKLAEEGEEFTMIFVDPPYGSDLISKVACDPALLRILETSGLLVIETQSGNTPKVASQFKKQFSRKYGGTLVEIFHLGSESI